MMEHHGMSDRDFADIIGGISQNEMAAAIDKYYHKFERKNCDGCKNAGRSCQLQARIAVAKAIRAQKAPDMSCAQKK